MNKSIARLVLDLGANRLQGLRLLLSKFPDFEESDIISFEPNPYLAKKSEQYQKQLLRDYPDIRHSYVNCAISATAGLVSLNCCLISEVAKPSLRAIIKRPKATLSYLSFYTKRTVRRLMLGEEYIYEASNILDCPPDSDEDNSFAYRREVVSAVTLEDVLRSAKGILGIDAASELEILIKVDIEGAEFEVLEGFLESTGSQTLNGYIFMVEWHERFFDQEFRAAARKEAIENLIRSRGGVVGTWH